MEEDQGPEGALSSKSLKFFPTGDQRGRISLPPKVCPCFGRRLGRGGFQEDLDRGRVGGDPSVWVTFQLEKRGETASLDKGAVCVRKPSQGRLISCL